MLPPLETVAFDQFPLKWRFTNPAHPPLPSSHLALIKPLSPSAADELWAFLRQAGILLDFPFTDGYFRKVKSIDVSAAVGKEGERRIRDWLYNCTVPFRRRIYLSYDNRCAVKTSWKMLVTYWSAFYYPSSDDIMVTDETLAWALFFDHEGQIHLGTNTEG